MVKRGVKEREEAVKAEVREDAMVKAVRGARLMVTCMAGAAARLIVAGDADGDAASLAGPARRAGQLRSERSRAAAICFGRSARRFPLSLSGADSLNWVDRAADSRRLVFFWYCASQQGVHFRDLKGKG